MIGATPINYNFYTGWTSEVKKKKKNQSTFDLNLIF